MRVMKMIVQGVFMFGSVMLATGCIVEPTDNYYDHDHHRYYHEHGWHDCGERDDHCR